ncbi:MAG: hypothetical protein HZA54_14320 [Planctomycetes bacterium]|nr:hypothetical protein [Planctomycetota bacterium]
MRRLTALVVLLGLAATLGCYRYTRANDFYRKPVAESKISFGDFLLIYAKDPKQQIGYLETQQIVPAGGRDPVDQHFVYNLRFQRLGFVADKGQTYRFVRDVETEYLGVHEIAVGAAILLKHNGEVAVERLGAR